MGERWRKGILGSQRLDPSLLFSLALFLISNARADTRRLFFCVEQRGELEVKGGIDGEVVSGRIRTPPAYLRDPAVTDDEPRLKSYAQTRTLLHPSTPSTSSRPPP